MLDIIGSAPNFNRSFLVAKLESKFSGLSIQRRELKPEYWSRRQLRHERQSKISRRIGSQLPESLTRGKCRCPSMAQRCLHLRHDRSGTDTLPAADTILQTGRISIDAKQESANDAFLHRAETFPQYHSLSERLFYPSEVLA